MFIHDELTYKNTPKLAILLEYENLNSLKLFSRLLISISNGRSFVDRKLYNTKLLSTLRIFKTSARYIYYHMEDRDA